MLSYRLEPFISDNQYLFVSNSDVTFCSFQMYQQNEFSSVHTQKQKFFLRVKEAIMSSPPTDHLPFSLSFLFFVQNPFSYHKFINSSVELFCFLWCFVPHKLIALIGKQNK